MGRRTVFQMVRNLRHGRLLRKIQIHQYTKWLILKFCYQFNQVTVKNVKKYRISLQN